MCRFLPQRDADAGKRADARTWGDDTREIQRIGGGHARCDADTLIPPHFAEQVYRLWPRKLLAHETRHKPSAANFALRFHAPERHEQIAPRRRDGLARDEIAEHDAPSQE